MFTKDVLKAMFKKNAKRNFCIYTNIGEGKGINGIDYMSFVGTCNYENHCIKGFADTYIVIEKTETGNENYFSGAKKDIYIPYECIMRVDFITDVESNFYDFDGIHNLKDIK